MLLPQYHDGVGNDADHDRRHAVEHVRNKANGIAEAIAAIFRQVNPGTDAERNAQQAGDRQNQYRTDDGIRHAAADFARRHGSLRQEGPVDRTYALVDQVAEDRHQRREYQDHGENRESGRRCGLQFGAAN